MPTCNRCATTKLPEEFYRRPDGSRRENECKVCLRERARDTYHKDPLGKEKRYASNIRKRYGLTVEEFHQMKETGCFLCGSHERLAIDHDHSNGKVRACLCFNCNTALGKFRDDPALMRRAAAYIEDWQADHAV